MALTMTPALQQAIRLLQLSSLDLQMEIQQALDSNLMLEAETDEPDWDSVASEPAPEAAADTDGALEEVTASETIPDDMPVDADWQDVFDDYAPSTSGSDDEGLQDYLQANLRSTGTLQEHLASQAQLLPVNERDAEIAANLIDAINEDGYLENWPELCVRLEQQFNVSPQQVEAVLRLVQDFDPPGVGARDLAECLRLQLLQLDSATPGHAAALRIVDGHLLLLARRDEAGLRRATGLDVATLRIGAALVRNLQPHPGRPFQAHESDYLKPDVIVAKKSGRWRVSLNPEHTPRLRINSHYQGFIKRADQSRDQLQLKQHLQ